MVSTVFKVSAYEVRRDTGMTSLEGWDSLGHLQLIVSVEAAFDVRFRTDRIPDLTTVGLIEDELESLASR